jgi:hypothetical protein
MPTRTSPCDFLEVFPALSCCQTCLRKALSSPYELRTSPTQDMKPRSDHTSNEMLAQSCLVSPKTSRTHPRWNLISSSNIGHDTGACGGLPPQSRTGNSARTGRRSEPQERVYAEVPCSKLGCPTEYCECTVHPHVRHYRLLANLILGFLVVRCESLIQTPFLSLERKLERYRCRALFDPR